MSGLHSTMNVQLVRVNPDYPEMPFRCHGVGVTDDATSALD
uniref:Uncharacterized protein n=1 Tax=Peronospora matthiolae TaxID=2874970 RepID=A0AAV1TTV6_9STRA